MHRLFLIIFSLFLICLETTTNCQPLGGGGDNGVKNKCSEKERLSLLHFKALLQDPTGYGCLSTWTAQEEDCCQWSGVTCDDSTGHVTRIDIHSCDLVGEISSSLLNLTYLYHLDLSANSFHGTIPKFIGSMAHLNYLALSHNSFHGTIPPEFGNLTNLQELLLSYVGRCRVENIEWLSHLSLLEYLFMDEISLAKQNHWVDVILSLPKLSLLYLSGCELSQVMYPYSSTFLNSSSSSIQFLYLGNNSLTSSMYGWLFPLTNNKLRKLDLSRNMLDGIPSYLSNLCSLEVLYFSNNSAVVRFPDFLNNLFGCTSLSLQELYASGNGFTGSLPDEIQEFTSLRELHLSHNQLNGTISHKLWQLPNLENLDVSSNYLRGAISNVSSSTLRSFNLSKNKFSGGISFICQIVSGFLDFLDLSQNFLRGPIPDCLWHLKELKVLNLGNNYLYGRLPTSVESLIKLEVLDVYNNEFSGELPLWLQNCTRLNLLNLGANKFSGNVPLWIGDNLSELYALMLTSNNFFGTIPSQLCQLQNLQILDLSKNSLHGTIPSCVNNLTAMVQEGPSENQNHHLYGRADGSSVLFYTYYEDHAMIGWQGVVREFFSNLVLLKMIDLSSNNLTGQIPFQLTNLKELVTLNLSNNALHGEIPWKIGEMKNLLVLDLSRNKFSGGIPSSMSQKSLLSYLDVSSNNLSGRIPTSTQLQSFNSSHYSGNAGLCGLPLPKKCSGDEESEVPSVVGESEGDGKGVDELQMWLYIGVGTGFPTGLWIACGALLLNRRGRHAFFHFYDSFRDWVYVKVVVFIANLKRDRTS